MLSKSLMSSDSSYASSRSSLSDAEADEALLPLPTLLAMLVLLLLAALELEEKLTSMKEVEFAEVVVMRAGRMSALSPDALFRASPPLPPCCCLIAKANVLVKSLKLYSSDAMEEESDEEELQDATAVFVDEAKLSSADASTVSEAVGSTPPPATTRDDFLGRPRFRTLLAIVSDSELPMLCSAAAVASPFPLALLLPLSTAVLSSFVNAALEKANEGKCWKCSAAVL